MKLNFPLGQTVSFLAWSLLDFPTAYAAAGTATAARNNIKQVATYLMKCHIGDNQYIGQIGDPGPDHSYWGRPEQQTGSRPYYTYTKATPASDLLGSVSAALTSSSLVLAASDAGLAAEMLTHAKALYEWGKANPGGQAVLSFEGPNKWEG